MLTVPVCRLPLCWQGHCPEYNEDRQNTNTSSHRTNRWQTGESYKHNHTNSRHTGTITSRTLSIICTNLTPFYISILLFHTPHTHQLNYLIHTYQTCLQSLRLPQQVILVSTYFARNTTDMHIANLQQHPPVFSYFISQQTPRRCSSLRNMMSQLHMMFSTCLKSARTWHQKYILAQLRWLCQVGQGS